MCLWMGRNTNVVKETKNNHQIFLKYGPCVSVLNTCFKLGPSKIAVPPNICGHVARFSCLSVLVDILEELA